jgi:hypothetical protein
LKIDINLGNINIANVQSNASVLYGESTQNDWSLKAKANTTIGRVSGDHNLIANRINLVNDPDLIDVTVTSSE